MKFTYYMTLEQLVGDRPEQGRDSLMTVTQAAEAAGFDACNLTDHPFPDADWLQKGGHNAFDPLAALCFVAGYTSRIKLHTNIVVLPYRNPFITAKEATTLDILSGGRLIMGVGVGYQPGEFEALGVDFTRRGKLMDEAIDVMKLAWKGEAMAYDGVAFRAANNIQLPRPVQEGGPPIWCGGNGMIAVRRAAQRCEGWTPFFTAPGAVGERHPEAISSIDDLKERIERLMELREEAGRSGPFDIAPMSPVPFRECSQQNADKFVAAAKEMEAAGVTWTSSAAPGSEAAEIADNLAWFGENVLPQLH